MVVVGRLRAAVITAVDDAMAAGRAGRRSYTSGPLGVVVLVSLVGPGLTAEIVAHGGRHVVGERYDVGRKARTRRR